MKGKREKTTVHMARHPLLLQPGPATGLAWLRLAAQQQNRGGRGTTARGGTDWIWLLAGGQGGQGRALEHEEAMGDRFETEMEPTGAHRALGVGVDRLERRWRALGVRSANTVVLGRWSWKRQRGRTWTEVGCPRACTRRGGRHQLIPWRCLVADSLMPGHRLGRQGRRLAGGCSGGMRGSRRWRAWAAAERQRKSARSRGEMENEEWSKHIFLDFGPMQWR
jgi:hypothetical protein